MDSFFVAGKSPYIFSRLNPLKGLVIVYRLGGGGGDLRRDHLIFERNKRGDQSLLRPKRGIAENFGRNKRGDHSNLLGK